jgi:hypothetical protein
MYGGFSDHKSRPTGSARNAYRPRTVNPWLGSCAVHLRTAAWTSTGNAIATLPFAWPRRGPPARLAAHILQRRAGARLAFAAMGGTDAHQLAGEAAGALELGSLDSPPAVPQRRIGEALNGEVAGGLAWWSFASADPRQRCEVDAAILAVSHRMAVLEAGQFDSAG